MWLRSNDYCFKIVCFQQKQSTRVKNYYILYFLNNLNRFYSVIYFLLNNSNRFYRMFLEQFKQTLWLIILIYSWKLYGQGNDNKQNFPSYWSFYLINIFQSNLNRFYLYCEFKVQFSQLVFDVIFLKLNYVYLQIKTCHLFIHYWRNLPVTKMKNMSTVHTKTLEQWTSTGKRTRARTSFESWNSGVISSTSATRLACRPQSARDKCRMSGSDGGTGRGTIPHRSTDGMPCRVRSTGLLSNVWNFCAFNFECSRHTNLLCHL